MKDICKHMKDGVCRKRLTEGMTICPDEYDPTLDGRCRLKTAVHAEWVERVLKRINTANLIAELEKRRHELCPKCANGKSVLCVECVWAGVYRAYRKDDNFKEAK